MSERNFALYAAAFAADEALQTELVRIYGVKKACEMRYRAPENAKLAALFDAKLAADSAWLQEMRRIDHDPLLA